MVHIIKSLGVFPLSMALGGFTLITAEAKVRFNVSDDIKECHQPQYGGPPPPPLNYLTPTLTDDASTRSYATSGNSHLGFQKGQLSDSGGRPRDLEDQTELRRSGMKAGKQCKTGTLYIIYSDISACSIGVVSGEGGSQI